MRIITLKDGRHETILDNNDLEYLIREELGDEVGDKIRDLIKQADGHEEDFDSDLRFYEAELDSRNSALVDIADIATGLSQYLYFAKRINRDKITDKIDGIARIVNDEI